MRVVSVGLTRLFRVTEVGDEKVGYRIEQAVKEPSPLGAGKKRWAWTPLAFATTWGEAHGAMHQMQADWTDRMIERQGSFRGDKAY
jgi:hypothetical protein